MRRFERRRVEQIRRTAITIGLSFALGALVDVALTWRLHEFDGNDYRPANGAARLDAWSAPRHPAYVPSEPANSAAALPTASQRGGGGGPPPVGTAGVVAHSVAVEMLRERDLDVPVDDVDRDELRDTFFDARGGRAHEAMDIMAPRGTEVRAVEDGTIARLFNSKGGGGMTIYQFDPTETFAYYYAHLDRYAAGLREGQAVERGETIGYVGSTGNASPEAPHLHFAIFRLTPERQWWKGDPINPYSVLR